ncbi:MAG TPA: MerR family transcriptional regulator [Limnochordia bacterium]|nr:MerR family transcriptional regulator [Limnochordia bacterium]
MSDVERGAAVYPIGVVQNLTGLSGRQIRYYEKMALLTPERTGGNQRLYSARDVELLGRIKALLADGLNIEGVRARLAAEPPGPAPEPPAPEPESAVERASAWPIRQGATRLTSLYPVRDQKALLDLLQTRAATQDDPASPKNRRP